MAWKVTHGLTLSYLSDLRSYHCPLASSHSALRFLSYIQVQLCTSRTSTHSSPLTKIKCSSLGVCVPYFPKSLLKYHFIREAFPVHPQYHHFSLSIFLSCFLSPQSSYHHLASYTLIYLLTIPSTTGRIIMAETMYILFTVMSLVPGSK